MAGEFPIVFALYPRVTQLDFTGPLEVLARLPGAAIVLAAVRGGELALDSGVTFANVRRAVHGIAPEDHVHGEADRRGREEREEDGFGHRAPASARTDAVTARFRSEAGRSTFHPNAMSWS